MEAKLDQATKNTCKRVPKDFKITVIDAKLSKVEQSQEILSLRPFLSFDFNS
jgi:hypothetical protein